MEWLKLVNERLLLSQIDWLTLALAIFSGFLFAVFLYVAIIRPTNKRVFLRDLNKTKGMFTNLASHYLLTPITIIQTAVARLQEGDANITVEQRQKLHDAIKLGQERLWLIAEQLILSNEMEQGSFSLRQGTYDIGTIVTDSLTHVDIIARNRGVVLHYTEQLGELRQVRVDRRRLLQSLVAILDNAIKFSEDKGNVHIRLTISEGLYRIEVEDRGIGMTPEVLEHLSEKFYRGSDLYAFNYEGIGLGLHLANAIIRMHSGVLRFESRPGSGTKAIVELRATVVEA